MLVRSMDIVKILEVETTNVVLSGKYDNGRNLVQQESTKISINIQLIK